MPLTRLKSTDAAARWLQSWVTGTLRSDSRAVARGDAFIAWPGHATDGRRYVTAALAAGAATCVVEADGVEAFGFDDARIAALPGLKGATGRIADAYFGHPSAALDVIAATGTNGKTSTAWWTAQALGALGRRCGVIGTLGIGEPPAAGGGAGTVTATGLTTPDPVALQAALRRFADAGFGACALEASSIGLDERRLDGTTIDVALFTNFTRDHLDYHGGMDGYWAAKRRLFGWPGLRAGVLHTDDAAGARLADELAGSGIDLWPVGTGAAARLRADAVRYENDGLVFDLHEAGAGDGAPTSVIVRTALVGGYNVGNLLVVLGALRALGVPLADAAAVVPRLTPVPGRLQRVGSGAPEVLVDYAHTPDAIEQVLRALRPLAAARGGKLWCVFGCGGNRDASKRPLMGAAAERGADHVVLTSDNPRHEAPGAILAQIAAGLARPAATPVIEDRRSAIVHALAGAAPADVVLVAGKGHEDYQEVAGERLPYSDVDVVQRQFQERRT
ncbi:MAG: UDP-N-acetylmuramoyl-L-alanyl-D-glutamate--2,6-diaminopimelate ligase [Rubrivivax sp.]